jgi:hypothetical protein
VHNASLVVPLIFNANASGEQSLTLYADELTDSVVASHEVNLDVPALDLQSMFTYVVKEANETADASLGYDMDGFNLDMRSCGILPNVIAWNASFDYASNVAGQPADALVPARLATDDEGVASRTPYGYWAHWLSTNNTAAAFAAVDANDDILSSETNSFGQSELFGANGILHTTASHALAAFFRNAAAHGKIARDTQVDASIGEGSNVTTNPSHSLLLIPGDSLVMYVKYSLSYALNFNINQDGASDLLDPSFNSSPEANAAGSELKMIIAGTLRTLSNVEDSETVIYKMKFNAV